MRHLRFPAVLVPSLMLVLASCAAATPTPAAGTTIDVAVQEWAVLPSQASAPAGEVTFTITNDGPDDIHEFVVMKTDLAPADLPTLEDRSVDEAGEGIEEVMGEIEEIPVGETMDLTVTLAAGKYVLLCNIYDTTEDEAHYEEGMHTAFTVE